MTIDVTQFMNATFTQANSTRLAPVPKGEYKAVIENVELAVFQGRKDPTQQYLRCNVTYAIDDAGLREKLGRDRILLTQGFLVDVTDSGEIDASEGRNIKLGRLREALGLNTPGQPWSFSMFKGRVLRIKVDHEMYEGEPQARVVATTKL